MVIIWISVFHMLFQHRIEIRSSTLYQRSRAGLGSFPLGAKLGSCLLVILTISCWPYLTFEPEVENASHRGEGDVNYWTMPSKSSYPVKWLLRDGLGTTMSSYHVEEFLFCSLCQWLLVLVAQIVVVSIVNPWTLLALLPLTLAYMYMRRRYIKSSREIKRLEAIGKFLYLSWFLIDCLHTYSAKCFKNAPVDTHCRPFISCFFHQTCTCIIIIPTDHMIPDASNPCQKRRCHVLHMTCNHIIFIYTAHAHHRALL